MTMNMRFMICDAETLGVDEGSVILDFSMVLVDFNQRLNYTEKELMSSGKRWKLDVSSQKLMGRTVDSDTVDWWKMQAPDVRKRCVLPSPNDIPIQDLVPNIEKTLKENHFSNKSGDHLNFWLASRGELEVKLLHNLYKSQGKSVQKDGFYDFWRWRDIRTMLHFLVGAERGYIDVSDETPNCQKHDSLHDCIIDALQIQKALAGWASDNEP